MSTNYLHTVKQGENLTFMSRQYNISIESIKSANPYIDWIGQGQNGHYNYPGEVLKLQKIGNPKSNQFLLASVIETQCKIINSSDNFWTRFWAAFHQYFRTNNPGGYMFWSDNV